MTLQADEKREIINYRLEKAESTFQEAVKVSELEMWNLCANRLYYSVFYMALALNLINGDFARSHNGVFNIISKRYVATEILQKRKENSTEDYLACANQEIMMICLIGLKLMLFHLYRKFGYYLINLNN